MITDEFEKLYEYSCEQLRSPELYPKSVAGFAGLSGGILEFAGLFAGFTADSKVEVGFALLLFALGRIGGEFHDDIRLGKELVLRSEFEKFKNRGEASQ